MAKEGPVPRKLTAGQSNERKDKKNKRTDLMMRPSSAKAPSYATMRGLTDELRANQKNKDKQELEPKVFKKRR